jgi:hypothetical protein
MSSPRIDGTAPGANFSAGDRVPQEISTREQLIEYLEACITEGIGIEEIIENLFTRLFTGYDPYTPGLLKVFGKISFPVHLFEGENLAKFRVEQLCPNPDLVEFLKSLPTSEKCIKLLGALFTYPAQRGGLGSCARSSYLINLWINDPLGYLKFAKQCLDDPSQVTFNVKLGDRVERITVPTGLTDGHGRSLSDVMECALSNLSLELDADGTMDRLNRAIRNKITQWGGEKANGVPLEEYREALKCVINCAKRIYNPEDGQFSFQIDEGELWEAVDALFGKLDFSSGKATSLNLIDFIKEKTSESTKGLTFDYLGFITSDRREDKIEFAQGGRISLDEARDLVGVLRDENGRGFATLARIQTISRETGMPGPGHGFNVRVVGRIDPGYIINKQILNSDVRVVGDANPGDLQSGQILNIGLSNYADEFRGKPYVGLKRKAGNAFEIVNYHPEHTEAAEPMAGTGDFLIKSITINPATFIEQG